MAEQEIKQSFKQALNSLAATIKEAYKLAPFVVTVLLCIAVAVSYISISSSKLMMGMVLLLVLGITIIVYATSGNFGEAALALVAGLLTAYSVTWTPSKFIAFVAVWSAFSGSALLISSLKLASRSEELYRQAAIAMSNKRFEVTTLEKQLQKITKDSSIQWLGPIEKAETILIFAYRKLPLESQTNALRAVGIISAITQLSPKQIASFIADAYKIFNFSTVAEQTKLVDILYKNIKESSVAPEEFICAFNNSRRLILSGRIEPNEYLGLLKKSLESGISPEDMYEYLEKKQYNKNV